MPIPNIEIFENLRYNTAKFLVWLLMLSGSITRGYSQTAKEDRDRYKKICNTAPAFNIANHPSGMNLILAENWQFLVPELCVDEFRATPPFRKVNLEQPFSLSDICSPEYKRFYHHALKNQPIIGKIREERIKAQDMYAQLFQHHFAHKINFIKTQGQLNLFVQLYEQVRLRNGAYITALIAKKHNLGQCQEASDSALLQLLELRKKGNIPKKIQTLKMDGSSYGIVRDHIALLLDSNIEDGKYRANQFFNVSAREVRGYLCDTWRDKPRMRSMRGVLSSRKNSALRWSHVTVHTVSFLDFPSHLSIGLRQLLLDIDIITNPNVIFQIATQSFLDLLGLRIGERVEL